MTNWKEKVDGVLERKAAKRAAEEAKVQDDNAAYENFLSHIVKPAFEEFAEHLEGRNKARITPETLMIIGPDGYDEIGFRIYRKEGRFLILRVILGAGPFEKDVTTGNKSVIEMTKNELLDHLAETYSKEVS